MKRHSSHGVFFPLQLWRLGRRLLPSTSQITSPPAFISTQNTITLDHSNAASITVLTFIAMDRYRMSVVFLFLLIVVDISDASFFAKFRNLAEKAPGQHSPAVKQIPPAASPIPAGVKSAQVSNESQALVRSPKMDRNGSINSKNVSPSPEFPASNLKNSNKGSNETMPVSKNPSEERNKNLTGSNENKFASPPPQNQTQNAGNKEKPGTEPTSPPPEKKDDGKGKSKDKPGRGETCTGKPNRCKDEKTLVACTLSAERSQEQMILVQNEGDESLQVKIFGSDLFKDPMKELKMRGHHSKRVNVTYSGSAGALVKITLFAGHGECVLHMGHLVSEGNFFVSLPSYRKLVTPINGAYFLIVTVIVFGGTWASCKLRKRGREDEIPYQELEMGASEGRVGYDVETAEGWDESWDDDWDEDTAVRSPGGRKNISVNGLTSRSSIKDS